MGVSKTQVVKYIRKGDKGDPGTNGAKGEQGAVLRGPQAWSDCATGYAFQAGGTSEAWKDVVLYNGNYYSCVKSHAKTASNYPGSTTDTNSKLWQLGDSIELVATKILLANYALVKNLGVETIDMRDASGNILFQAKDGNVTCKTGTFENVVISGILKTTLYYGKTKTITEANYTIDPATSPYNWYLINEPSIVQYITLPKASDYDGLEISFFIKNSNWVYGVNTTHVKAAAGEYICIKRNVYNVSTSTSLENFAATFRESSGYWMMQPNMAIKFKSIFGKWYAIEGLWTGE